MATVGENIRKFREKQGISRKDFAESIGIPYSTYANYENGYREPDKETLNRIAAALDIPCILLLDIPLSDVPTKDLLKEIERRCGDG